MQLDVFTLFPEWFDWFAGSATSPTRSRAGHELRSSTTATHAAERRAGRRHAVRRRRRDGAARRRRRRGAARLLRRRPVDCAASAASIALTPGGPCARRRARRRAGRASPTLTLLCGRYEGFDERIVQHFCVRHALDRPLRARRRRARGDGRGRRGRCASCPARSAMPTPRSRSPSAPRWVATRSTRTTRGPPSTAAGACPEVLLSGHHERDPRTGAEPAATSVAASASGTPLPSIASRRATASSSLRLAVHAAPFSSP